MDPMSVEVKKPVTIHGTGFDQGSVVLLGQMAPRILKRSDTQLVFAAPGRPMHEQAFLVTPGNPVLGLGDLAVRGVVEPGVMPGPTPARSFEVVPGSPSLLFDEKVTLSSAMPKIYRIDMGGANAVSVVVACTGGDAKVEARPEASAEPVVSESSWQGELRWTVTQRLLKATEASPLGPILVSFSTKSEAPLGCAIRIGRSPMPEKK